MTRKPTYEELEKKVGDLEFENARLQRAEQECSFNEARLQSLVEILQHPAALVQEILEFSLEEAISLTESQIGYIYHFDEKNSCFILNNWSKGAMEKCSIVKPQTVYNLEETGIWGEAVRQEKPIVINDFKASHPLKKGYPPGHAEIYKYMTVPIINENRIVAVIGLANKKTDYSYSDVLHVTLLMDAVWKMVQRKQAEEALRKSEELLRKTQEIAQLGSWELDVATGELTWSEQVYRIFGMAEKNKSIAYETFLEAILPGDRRAVSRTFNESLKKGKDSYEIEHRLIRKDTGEIRHVHEKCEHVKDDSGKIVRSVGMVADITRRKQVEEQLRKFNFELEKRVKERTSELNKRTRQLQHLALALSQAEDREQQKISQILHEDLQQMLVSARLQLDILNDTENPEHRNIIIEKTRKLLQESLKQTRNLSQDLSPPILSYAGLKEALEWLGRKMEERYGLEIHLEVVNYKKPQSKTIERFLFRSAREMLFNVVKHAGVKHATVVLRHADEGFSLSIADKGCGFDLSSNDSGKFGVGLYSIKERIDLLGGSLDIKSTPGEGTRSEIFIPDSDKHNISSYNFKKRDLDL